MTNAGPARPTDRDVARLGQFYNARLRDLEQRAADLITVADAHGIVGQSFDGEVLAELSVDEVGPPQLLLPLTIRFDLVDEDGTLLSPVPGQVTVTVSV